MEKIKRKERVFMKKSFKAGMIAAALFAIAPMGVSMVNSSTTVHADKVVPGRGKKYTFPKSWRGTWYANNSKARHKKVVFGVHTFNGKTVYHQIDENATAEQNSQKGYDRLTKITKNMLIGDYSLLEDGKYVTLHPWHWNYTMKWDLFQPRTMKIKGKKVMYLKGVETGEGDEGINNIKFFKSRRLAKKY